MHNFFQIHAQYARQCEDTRIYWHGPPYNDTVETTVFDEIWNWEMDMSSLHGG
jgi:hypothetical protein